MDYKKKIRPIACVTAIVVAIWVVMCLLVHFTCSYTLCFAESAATFANDDEIIYGMMARPGGLAHVVALWVIQWCSTTSAATPVMGTLLTAIAILLGVFIGKVAPTSRWFALLAIAPAVSLILVQRDIDYSLAGTVAFAMAAAGWCIVSFIKKFRWRVVAGCIAAIALWLIAGQAAMLFAVVLFAVEAVKRPRSCAWYWIPVAAVFTLAYMAVRDCVYPTLGRALLPDGWYTAWITVGSEALTPWIVTTAVVLIAAIGARLPKSATKLAIVALIGECIYIGTSVPETLNNENPVAVISYPLARGDWEGVNRTYGQLATNDTIAQNINNMALAERGLLPMTLFHQGNLSPKSIYNTTSQNRYDYMALSDLYWSMGLIGASQRYAFEANEALGNLSPRMLTRLADCAIVYGNYPLAEKYLTILSTMRQYSDAAVEKLRLVDKLKKIANVDGADATTALLPEELAAKRKCIFSDNRFAAYQGVDNDLLQVIRANPDHSITLDYLGCVYLLRRDIPSFIALIEEFNGTPAMQSPLPEHFQEAVAVASLVDKSDLYVKYSVHPSVLEKCTAFWRDHRPQPNTLWQYLRSKDL